MKKIIFCFLEMICLCCFVFVNCSAEGEPYYLNDNGISFTKKEYELFSYLTSPNIVKNMTINEYNQFAKLKPDERTIIKSSIIDNTTEGYNGMISPYATTIATSYKRVSIAGSCIGDSCTVSLVTTWLKNPNVRSYDLFGARFLGTTLTSTDAISTIMASSYGTTEFRNYKITSNGFGNSIKLQSGATDFYISEHFLVRPGGTVFGSYQHATKSISIGTSRNYSISLSGYGSVFLPYGTLVDVLDEMAGVYIYLS